MQLLQRDSDASVGPPSHDIYKKSTQGALIHPLELSKSSITISFLWWLSAKIKQELNKGSFSRGIKVMNHKRKPFQEMINPETRQR